MPSLFPGLLRYHSGGLSRWPWNVLGESLLTSGRSGRFLHHLKSITLLPLPPRSGAIAPDGNILSYPYDLLFDLRVPVSVHDASALFELAI